MRPFVKYYDIFEDPMCTFKLTKIQRLLMKLLITSCLLILATACHQKRTNQIPLDKKITRDFQKDANTLLPDGEFVVDIMDEITMSPRKQALQRKFMEGVSANQEWFLAQRKIVEQTGKPLAYDPRVGMTKAEWEEYQKLMANMSDMTATSSGTAKVTIKRKGDIISFQSEGKLSYLNATVIDTKNKIVKVFGQPLSLVDTVNVTNGDNVFKTAWRGYKFEFSHPEHIVEPTTAEELANFSMSLYGFTLGLFEKTGKTYIEIKGMEIKQGQQTGRYQIPIVFQ